MPVDICGLNLELEAAETSTGELDSPSEMEDVDDDNDPSDTPATPRKTNAPVRYDPLQPEKVWILETFAKVGAPVLVESWEEEQRVPKSFAKRKARQQKQVGKSGMNPGALDAYVKITKPAVLERAVGKPPIATSVVPAIDQSTCTTSGHPHNLTTKAFATPIEKRKKPSESSLINPWTLSRRPADTFAAKLPSGTRYSALGIYSSSSKNQTSTNRQRDFDDPFVETATLEISPDLRRKRTTPRPHSSLDDSNVTVRRKRKAKTLTKAYTAPCGTHEIIDLDSPEGSPNAGSLQRQMTDPLGLFSEHGSKASLPQDLDFGRLEDAVVQAPILHDQEISISRPREWRTKHESHKVNRVNLESNITGQGSPTPASPTGSDSLPSPSTLIRRTGARIMDFEDNAAASFGVFPPVSRPHERTAKFVMLRESLEGAWRDTETVHGARQPARAFSNVSVVDLTSE